MTLIKYSCLVLVLFAIFGSANILGASAESINFRIERKNVSEALLEFAQQANISILIPREQFEGLVANPLNGIYSIESGLEILLLGTGVDAYISTSSNQLVIQSEFGSESEGSDNTWPVQNNTLLGVISSYFGKEQTQAELTEERDQSSFADRTYLERILVTAQRREEALLETPVTITAVGSEQIEQQNIRTFEKLSVQVPGMEIEPDGRRTTIRVRGLGTTDGAPAAENITALYIDGVYLSHRNNLDGYFFDIDQIEVLLGPQGTLYGRNTAAGAINIRTAQPAFENTGALEIEAGNYDSARIFGMFNQQLSDNVAVRAAIQNRSNDGYFKSEVDEFKDTHARLSLLWQANERLSVLAKMEYGDVWQRGIGTAYLGSVNNTDPDNWRLTWRDEALWYDDSLFHPPGNAIDQINQSLIETRKLNVMSELNYAITRQTRLILNFARIKEKGHYRVVNIDGEASDHSGTGVWGGLQGSEVRGRPWVEKTAEVRLQGRSADQLDWTIGYFYWSDDTNEPATDPNGLSFNNIVSLAESEAIYGQLTWRPLDLQRWQFTLGARHTVDWKQWDLEVNNFNLITVGGSNGLQDRNWDNNDYKFGVAYDLDSEDMLYANYSTGYRAGSWFPGAFPSYDPEYVDAYEIGWKGRVLEDTVELSANVFMYEYSNAAMQFNTFNTLSSETEISLANLGDADISGANFNGNILLTRNNLLQFNFDFTDSEFSTFDFSSHLAALPSNYTLFNAFDWQGLELPNTSRYRLTLSWMHDAYTRFGALNFHLQGVWNSARYYNYRTSTLQQYKFEGRKIPSYSVFNWNVSFRPAQGNWEAGFYIANILNEKVLNSLDGGSHAPDIGGTVEPSDLPGTDNSFLFGTLRAPRTFGVRLRYDF